MIAIETHGVAVQLLADGIARKVVANRLSLSVDQVDRIAKGWRPVQRTKAIKIRPPREPKAPRPAKVSKLPPPKYLPTLEEIAAECRKIQETWDEMEFTRRAYWHVTNLSANDPRLGWSAPVYADADLAAA